MTENGTLAKRRRVDLVTEQDVPHVRAGSFAADERYRHWRESHVPLLYDWLSSRRTAWPSACVQWGGRLEVEYARNNIGGGVTSGDAKWGLYLSERTGAKKEANTLLLYGVKIKKEFGIRVDDVNKGWVEEYKSGEALSCPEFQLRKRIVHNGEVNRVRCLKDGWVATHTDDPYIFVWDMHSQEHRPPNAPKEQHNRPTLTLVGHKAVAEYALAATAPDPANSVWVASGGKDENVLVWKLEDYEAAGSVMHHSVRFRGHAGNVEDVCFNPRDRNLLASVGQDRALYTWDVLNPYQPTSKVKGAHQGDGNGVDWEWSEGWFLLTSGDDKYVRLWDRRHLSDSSGAAKPLMEMKEHTDQVLGVQWNPNVPGVFASYSEDGQVIIWDIDRTKKSGSVSAAPGKSRGVINPAVMFRHCGHRYRVVDAQWLPDKNDPWCMTSVSEDRNGMGSTVQVWRMFDMIHRNADEIRAQIQEM